MHASIIFNNFFIKFRSSTDTSSPSGWSKQISFEVTAVTAVTASSSFEILVNSTNLGTTLTPTSAGDMVIYSTISHNFKSETTVPSVLILSKSQLASQFSMTPDTKQQAFRDSLTFLIVSSETITIDSLVANAPTDSSTLVYVDS